jgi:hypothetical protein
MRRVPEVWKYSACVCCYASSYHQTMAFSWWLAILHWPYSSPIFQGTPIYVGCYDYFTKWTEAISLKNMTHAEVIEFITEHIIHIFGIP